MSAFTGLSLVIEPNDLLERLDAPELILVDLTSSARYEAGHIRGARFVDPKRTQLGKPPAPGLLPDTADLEQLFGELGHNPDAVYVVYDDEGGGWAGRFIWLLDVIGHSGYHYLDGGVLAWEAQALPLSTEVPLVAGGPVALTLHDEPTATREYLQSRLGADDLAIWDARAPTNIRAKKWSRPKVDTFPAQSTSSGRRAWIKRATCAFVRTCRRFCKTWASRRTRK